MKDRFFLRKFHLPGQTRSVGMLGCNPAFEHV
jgi:hypothetical protein